MPATTTSLVTWIAHAATRIDTPAGKAIYIDPWLRENPACPDGMKRPRQVDAILLTHGHFDHLGDTLELARLHHPTIVCNHEISVWLAAKGVENVIGMNKGGTVEVAGVRVTMVGADHSSGIQDGDELVYGGEPAGFVLTLPDGFKVYHAGDTNVFGDMRIVGELYRPDLALLPIGGHYVMSPTEAAYAARLLGIARVIPIHYGTFPILAGTPAQLREALAALSPPGPPVEVIDLPRGGTWGGGGRS